MNALYLSLATVSGSFLVVFLINFCYGEYLKRQLHQAPKSGLPQDPPVV